MKYLICGLPDQQATAKQRELSPEAMAPRRALTRTELKQLLDPDSVEAIDWKFALVMRGDGLYQAKL